MGTFVLGAAADVARGAIALQLVVVVLSMTECVPKTTLVIVTQLNGPKFILADN